MSNPKWTCTIQGSPSRAVSARWCAANEGLRDKSRADTARLGVSDLSRNRATLFRTTRRSFLAGAAASVTAPWIVPSRILGKDGGVVPSNRMISRTMRTPWQV